MRLLKITALVAAVALLSLFGYANLRILSTGEKEKMVELTSFKLQGDFDAEKISALQEKIQQQEGVRACTINAASKTACVIYYKDQIATSTLASMLVNNTITAVEKKDLAASAAGGCPVHKVGASWDRLLSSLDLRTH